LKIILLKGKLASVITSELRHKGVWGNESAVPHILSLSTGRRWAVSFTHTHTHTHTHRALFPDIGPRYFLGKRAGQLQHRSGHFGTEEYWNKSMCSIARSRIPKGRWSVLQSSHYNEWRFV